MLHMRLRAAACALAAALAGTLNAQTAAPCLEMPAAYEPFASIHYVTAPIANGDV